PDPARRAARAVAAAQAMVQAGVFDVARDLLTTAGAGPLDGTGQARADLVRAQLAFVADRGSDAPPLLLRAARQLQSDDPVLARTTYLEAVHAALFAGHLASPGAGVRDVVLAARAELPTADTASSDAAPSDPALPNPAGPADLLLDGLATHFRQGYRAAVPVLRRALRTAGDDIPGRRELHWLWLSCITAVHLWDERQWDALTGRHAHLARDTGNLSERPLSLTARAYLHLFTGELTMAAALAGEIRDATEATQGHMAPYSALGLAAVRGQEAETRALIGATEQDMARRGEGIGMTTARWAAAILYNGLGRHEEALAAAAPGSEHPDELGLASWSAVELIEAAVRAGQAGRADGALRRLSEMAAASGTDWVLGVEARSRALVSEGESAERLYRTALHRLGRTRMRLDLARAHLLYGEWLRQENRRADAREHLRTAHQMLTGMGAAGFAERARRELAATGESVARIAADPAAELTAQEVQIALRARGGQTNAEIGAELFLSPRTVEWHLRKVFTKLGITSRRHLDRALSGPGRTAASQLTVSAPMS
ncbi:MAG: LuxR C-terminal-related transcriptional regulator, partial [Streptosporangiaceae bacterium]